MHDSEKLVQLFEKFPGIGPRQARRFVYFLLRSGAEYRHTLTQAIAHVGSHIHTCTQCGRYYTSAQEGGVCGICGNTARDSTTLMVVEKDADLEAIEKSASYSGRYFLLGRLLRLTEAERELPRQRELIERVSKSEVREVIIALPVTTEGEHTATAVEQALIPLRERISITVLGRGLSTGSELEYADADTLKHALESRR